MSSCGCGCGSGEQQNPAVDFQYSAKLLCGKPKENDGLAPGQYETLINVHNPSRCDVAHVRWKVARANLLGGDAGPISAYLDFELKPDHTLRIDCRTALKLSQMGGSFFDGWLVLLSGIPLDIAAVYTSVGGSELEPSVSIERVPERCIPRCNDVVYNIGTGIAGWKIQGGDYVYLMDPNASQNASIKGDWQSLGNAMWAYDPTQGGDDERTFELQFELCDGFTFDAANSSIELAADNKAYVSLNGVPLNGGAYSNTNPWHHDSGPSSNPSMLTLSTSALVAGVNTLLVKVKNDGYRAGFILCANLAFKSGQCPGYSIAKPPCPTVVFDVWCNKGKKSDEDWYSNLNSGQWLPASTTPHCCPDGKLIDGRIKGFRVKVVGTTYGAGVVYSGHFGKVIGGATWDSGEITGPSDCGPYDNAHNNWALQSVCISLVNVPTSCTISYQITQWKGETLESNNGGSAGGGDKSAQCMTVWVH